MEETLTDPADRLAKMLSKGLNVPTHETYKKFWATVFDLQKSDLVEIHSKLALVRDMLGDIEGKVNRFPVTPKLHVYLQPLTSIRALISQANLESQWSKSKSELEIAINGLNFCSERLQVNYPETALNQCDIDGIRKQVDDLRSKLSDSNIPRNLKLILFDLLKSVCRCIDEYIFRGSKGLRKEIFAIIAELEENWDVLDKNRDTEEVKGFFAIVHRLDSISSVALNVKQLAEGLVPYMPLLLQTVK